MNKKFRYVVFIVLLLAFNATNIMGMISNLVKTKATEDSSQIARMEVRKGGETGEKVADLLTDSDYTFERDTEYSLLVSVKKTDSSGYVRLRFGEEDEDGNITYNGLIFENPPGATYNVGEFEGHSYLDAIAKRNDAPNPQYGTNEKTKYSMQDGEIIYHIKDTVPVGNEVQFVMQFRVNDIGYDNSGVITDGIQLETGTMDESKNFTGKSSKTSSLNVEKKPALSSIFNGTTKTATLGGDGQILTYYVQEADKTEQVGILYETQEFDVVYPKGATIGDYGLNSSYAKTDSTRGTLEKSGEPVEDQGNMRQHFIVKNGMKTKAAASYFYYNLNFPNDGTFKDQEKVTTTIENMVYNPKKGESIEVPNPTTKVTYTISDPNNDVTTVGAVNRTTGDGVYNVTGATTTDNDPLVSMGGCIISNGNTVATPVEKTYEAEFNTTNTAAVINYITVPWGTNSTPKVELTGKTSDGTTKTVTIDDASKYKMTSRLGMVFAAEDFGMTAFTGVKAEIGKLSAGYASCSWTSNFEVLANFSAAWGYFTTDEPGIVVKNSFRLYNTDPSKRQNAKGDLSVTNQVLSSKEARVGYSGSTPGIYKAGTTTKVNAVNAGESVTITGTVYPYQVPYAEGVTENGVLERGNTSFIVDPVFYITLPKGMTQEDMAFKMQSYSTNVNKTVTTTIPSSEYTVENISYMNQSDQEMNLYKVTFPGKVLGYVEDGSDESNAHAMIRNILSYSVTLKTSKSLKTQNYNISDLFGISSTHKVKALPYNSRTTLNTVQKDVYGINDGVDYASVLPESSKTYFGVQQQAEINVDNSVKVENIEGEAVNGDWVTYDESDPNSVLMLGRRTSGKYRLRVSNTNDLTSEDISLVLPMPNKGEDLGAMSLS